MMILFILCIIAGSVVLLIALGMWIVPMLGAGVGHGVMKGIQWSQTAEGRANAFVADKIVNGFGSKPFDANHQQMHEQAMAMHQQAHDQSVAMQEQAMTDMLVMDEMNQMHDPYINPGQDLVVDESYHGIDHGSMDSMHDPNMDFGGF